MWITLLMIDYIQSGNKNTVFLLNVAKEGNFFHTPDMGSITSTVYLSWASQMKAEAPSSKHQHETLGFLKVLRFSFPVPGVVGSSAKLPLSLAFAAGNIKNLPLALRSHEEFELDLTCGKVYMKPPKEDQSGCVSGFYYLAPM